MPTLCERQSSNISTCPSARVSLKSPVKYFASATWEASTTLRSPEPSAELRWDFGSRAYLTKMAELPPHWLASLRRAESANRSHRSRDSSPVHPSPFRFRHFG